MSRQDDVRYLLTELRRRGYTLTANDGKLNVAPGSRLTDGERVEVAEYKVELLALLASEVKIVPTAEWDDQDREIVRLAKCGAFQWWYQGVAERMKW